MLLMSFRLNKRLLSILCSAAGILVLAVAVMGVLSQRSAEVPVSIRSSGAVVKNYTVATNQERLGFIAQFGWEVEEEPCEIMDVVVPKEFDEVYENYNEIQKSQGLDLSRYRGKQVKRYTYRVVNYPDCGDEVRLNLLVAESKVVGGDVCSLALDGFMHGLRYDG